MKFTGKISKRELSDIMIGLPIDLVFTNSLSGKFDNGIAVLLKESSQNVRNMSILPFDKGSNSILNEYREKLGLSITDNFELKMLINKIKSGSNSATSESKVIERLNDVKGALERFGNGSHQSVSLSRIVSDYVAGGVYALSPYLANRNNAEQVSKLIDTFVISLKSQVDQGVTLESRNGISKKDIQCIIVDDAQYESICEILPGTGIHAVQRSTFERSLSCKGKERELEMV